MSKTYFHLNPVVLNTGDVIPKGFFGYRVNQAIKTNLIKEI